MNHTTENSGKAGGLVIEVIGPLVDDRDLMARTYADLLAGEGVVLRPGAIDQVAGASIDWALRTLLEGHGRFDLIEQIPALERRVVREWEGFFASGLLRLAPRTEAAWAQILGSGAPVLLLFVGEPHLIPRLFSGLGLGLGGQVVVGGSGARGLPYPDVITAWLATNALPVASVRAAIRSPAAALGTGGAALGEICLIREASPETGMLPIDATVATIAAFMDRLTTQD